MDESSAELSGRVLRAWREHSGMSAADLARAIPVQPSAVSMWESGHRGRKPAASLSTVDDIAQALNLSVSAEAAMVGMWQSVASVDAIPARVSWFHNYPLVGGPVWAWVRVPAGRRDVRVVLRWGPFVRRLAIPFTENGVVINSPTSVPNPPLELVFDDPGWADFGTGTVPPDVGTRLGITVVDARGYVDGPDDPTSPPLDHTDERQLRPWLASMQNVVEKLGAPWAALAPTVTAALRPNRAAHALDGGTVEATATPGAVLTDDYGSLVSQLLLTPEQIQRLRTARGLSRAEAAKQATALTPASPITSKALEKLETVGTLPDATNAMARLDMIYRADGRVGVNRTINTRTSTERVTGDLTISFPHYWCGHIWLQPRGSHPADTGTVELTWGPWRRRQHLRSGAVITTRQATINAPPLYVRLPNGWHLAAGTGVVPAALDINVGWTPKSILAAAGLIRDNLTALKKYFHP